MELKEEVLYKFEKDHCPICKTMESLFQSFLELNPEVVYEKVDAVKEIDLSEKLGITTLPVFVYVKNEEFQMLSGLVDKKEFGRFTKNFLKSF